MCTPPTFKRKVFITSVSLEADNHLFPAGRLGRECLSTCQSHGCFSPEAPGWCRTGPQGVDESAEWRRIQLKGVEEESHGSRILGLHTWL